MKILAIKTIMQGFRHFKYESHNLTRLELLSAVGEVSVLCVVLVAVVHAAGFSASFEPESATLSGGTTVTANNGASSSRYMVFGGGVPSAPVVTPTPVPTPNPIPTSPVLYGWQLNSSNTGLAGAGIARSSLPVFSGTVTAGMTISQKKITTTLDLSTIPNVTLDRVWLVPVGGNRALITGPGTIIKDSDIDGTAMVSAERMGIYSSGEAGYTISRVAISKVSIGAWLDGYSSANGTMTDTYIYNLISLAGAHVDGLTRRGGTGVLAVTRSRIDPGTSSVTGAFFLQNTWGDRIAGVSLKDTYLEGAGYSLTLENKGTGTSVSLDNVRIRSVGYGPVTTSGTINFPTWNNVRIYDSNKLPAADGTSIAIP